MRNAVLVGIMIVSLAGFNQEIRAQGSWTPGPPGGIPIQPPCGEPTPNIQEPSPGDSTPCWEYKWSDGWVKLFECIEEIECPEVTCEPVPGEGCACLVMGDSESFLFSKPVWEVEPGVKEIKPDNPACGDAVEEEITPGETDTWLVVGGEGVVEVEPPTGSGDAEFTVTAVGEGCAALEVIWRLALTMDEECSKDFSESGPVVDVCVIDPDSSSMSKKSRAKQLKAGGGDCEVKEVNDVVSGNGGAIPPTISLNTTCTKACLDDEKNCTKYRLVGKAEMAKPPDLKVGTKMRWKVGPTAPWYVISYLLCDRDPDRIKETKKHEEQHCEGYMEGVKAVIAFVDGHEMNKKVYDNCEQCQEMAKIIIDETKALWEQLLEHEMNHNTFKDVDKHCDYYNGDALPGETPCETEIRICGKYDPNNPDDKGYKQPEWEDVKQEPCN